MLAPIRASVVLLALLFAGCRSLPASSDLLSRIIERDSLRVGLSGDQPPSNMRWSEDDR